MAEGFYERFYRIMGEREAALCARCGEPLSLPLKGFEDKEVLDACYCVGCRPEAERQHNLKLEAQK